MTTERERESTPINHCKGMETTANCVSRARHMVAIPAPGRGHINPMFSLCRRLASRGLLVTVVVTHEWLLLLSSSSSSPFPSNLRLRAIPDVLPSERARGAHYAAFVRAVLTEMPAPVEALMAALEPPAELILADALLPWVAAIGRRNGVPVAALFPQAAAVLLALLELPRLGEGSSPAMDARCKYLPKASSTHLPDFTTKTMGQSMHTTFLQVISWLPRAHCLLFNSPHELETQALRSLAATLSPPIYSIGPSIDVVGQQPAATYLQWLDSHPPSSVLYVSLGSFLPVSPGEVNEMALGLGLSGHPFLWAVHGEDSSSAIRELLGSSGCLGLVVPWCEQPTVLCHPAVGGFLTHCGWNSTLEAAYAGVPMLAYPLMWDQYPNSVMVVDDWKVGYKLKGEEEDGGRAVKGEDLARLVQKLMDLGEPQSVEVRRRAKLLREMLHGALGEKGSSMVSIDAFVHEVVGDLARVKE